MSRKRSPSNSKTPERSTESVPARPSWTPHRCPTALIRPQKTLKDRSRPLTLSLGSRRNPVCYHLNHAHIPRKNLSPTTASACKRFCRETKAARSAATSRSLQSLRRRNTLHCPTPGVHRTLCTTYSSMDPLLGFRKIYGGSCTRLEA